MTGCSAGHVNVNGKCYHITHKRVSVEILNTLLFYLALFVKTLVSIARFLNLKHHILAGKYWTVFSQFMGGMCQKNQLKTGYVLAFNIRLYAKNVNEIGTFFLHFKALKQYINVRWHVLKSV